MTSNLTDIALKVAVGTAAFLLTLILIGIIITIITNLLPKPEKLQHEVEGASRAALAYIPYQESDE